MPCVFHTQGENVIYIILTSTFVCTSILNASHMDMCRLKSTIEGNHSHSNSNYTFILFKMSLSVKY